MALTPSEELTQARVFSITEGDGDGDITQARVLAIYSFPTEQIDLSQGRINLVTTMIDSARVSQARVIAIVRGRVYNPKLRAWTFNLDGHSFYVLRLADEKTLVYDITTKQWSWWTSDNHNYWRASVGTNWKNPGSQAYEHGSNVVVGDDTFGVLWMLNPLQGYDDHPYSEDTPTRFTRQASAQIATRARTFLPCYEVYLSASTGQPALEGSSVSLSYSDDEGQTFVPAGTITTTTDRGQEFAWRSLGLVRQPGRIFKIEDDGAFARIDSLDVSFGNAPAA